MKTALLTGASSGIGTAIANNLTTQGWQVIGIFVMYKIKIALIP